MQDRVPTPGQEGRVFITPEDGSPPFYAKITMADNPTNQGTALNKQNLLQDSTEVELFGNASNRTVDEAFSGIAGKINLIMQDVASMTLTVQDSAGTGIPGVLINGMLDADGESVYTNAFGVAVGYVSEGLTILSISGYADIENFSEQIQAVKGETYTKTIVVTTLDFLKITSSRFVKFSENVEQIDVSVGGPGGGGAGAKSTNNDQFSCGGGGGHTEKQEHVSFNTNENYQAIIGAGGNYGKNGGGSSGGTSSFLGVTATSGTGGEVGNGSSYRGIGNGDGGYINNGTPIDGSPGTETIYSSFTDETPYGGGGGAAIYDRRGDGGHQYSSGGSPGGGDGDSTGEDGADNLGGGGGAGIYGGIAGIHGGRGGSGCVAIRMHLKSAS